MKRETLLTIAVAVLFLLNLGIIGFLLLNQMPHHPPHHRPPVDRVIIEGLGLDNRQQEQFEELKHEHRSQMVVLDNEYNTVVEEYFNLLGSDTAGVSSKDSLESEMAAIQTKRAQVTLEHFRQLKQICTPEQQKKFDSIISKLVQVMIPQGHRGGPPPKF